MWKLVFVSALLALAALLACGGDNATRAPADTPAPQPVAATPVPEPTAAPDYTATPEPTATPVPAPSENRRQSDSREIAALPVGVPEAIKAELSEPELACLTGPDGTGRMLRMFASPELGTDEEWIRFIGCLEDETVLRLFFTGMLRDTVPLHGETAACIRTAMDGNDLRSVMLAGMDGDAQAAMVGSMTAYLSTLLCLSDEELAMAGPGLGVTQGDREAVRCVAEALGGPEGLAALHGSGNEAALSGIMEAAAGCELQEFGAHAVGPAPGSGGPVPQGVDGPAMVVGNLSESEKSCLDGTGGVARLRQALAWPELATREEHGRLIGCLEDETLLRLFLPGPADSEPLSEETQACIRTRMEVVDLRSVMLAGVAGDAATSMAGSMTAYLLVLSCLNEEELLAAGPSTGMSVEEQKQLQCVIEAVGGPEGFAAPQGVENETNAAGFLEAAAECER